VWPRNQLRVPETGRNRGSYRASSIGNREAIDALTWGTHNLVQENRRFIAKP
jgi:hypothetical protein